MNRAVRSQVKLRELLARGALPASACGNALRQLVAPLIAGGVLTWQRSGAGQQLVVTSEERLAQFVATTYPYPSDGPAGLLPTRVSGVACYRDSKALANDAVEIINLRGWSDSALLCYGNAMSITSHTRRHGVFSFLLDNSRRHTLHEPCALVENPALFTGFERLNLPVKTVFFGRGRASARMLDWFSSQTDDAFYLLHLPDYDPFGLDEFLRLRTRLGNRVRLHVPNDLQQRFARFGNCNLLSNPSSQTILAKLRCSECAEIIRVVALIDQFNGGLEQEALLL